MWSHVGDAAANTPRNRGTRSTHVVSIPSWPGTRLRREPPAGDPGNRVSQSPLGRGHGCDEDRGGVLGAEAHVSIPSWSGTRLRRTVTVTGTVGGVSSQSPLGRGHGCDEGSRQTMDAVRALSQSPLGRGHGCDSSSNRPDGCLRRSQSPLGRGHGCVHQGASADRGNTHCLNPLLVGDTAASSGGPARRTASRQLSQSPLGRGHGCVRRAQASQHNHLQDSPAPTCSQRLDLCPTRRLLRTRQPPSHTSACSRPARRTTRAPRPPTSTGPVQAGAAPCSPDHLDAAVAEGGVLADVQRLAPTHEWHERTDRLTLEASLADEATDVVTLSGWLVRGTASHRVSSATTLTPSPRARTPLTRERAPRLYALNGLAAGDGLPHLPNARNDDPHDRSHEARRRPIALPATR